MDSIMKRFARTSVIALISLHAGHQLANAQFSIYEPAYLDDELGDRCIEALTAQIDCSPFVEEFQRLSYRGDLDVELTDSICTADCSFSLKSWFDAVSGGIATRYGGYMWAGFNETCVKDPRPPHAYCNSIIANFTVVSRVQEMPRSELCHTCHVRRLALMQASQYSMYDEYYKEKLEYVYSKCKLTGPTSIPESIDAVKPAPLSYCLSDKRYTTKQGDTCQSISNSTNVSSAYLYMGNQELLKDCSSVTPGLSVCIPLTCKTYYLQQSDTCWTIEGKLGLGLHMLQRFNSWLDVGCTNLHTASGFYGRYICVSPQGGKFKNPDKPPVPDLIPSIADGHMRDWVAPPEGAKVAEGTTRHCGKWHIVAAADTCAKICLMNGIDTNLFHEANPSLGPGADCDASLEAQTALCTGPRHSWKLMRQKRFP